MNIEFVRANLDQHRDLLIDFNIEYLSWIDDSVQDRYGLSLPSLLGMPIPDYVHSSLDKLCEGTPPDGVVYLVFDGEVALGMGGLRRIRDGVGEIKRIYVSRTSRGGGVGAKVLNRLVRDARSFGYQDLVLDTGPFMTSAHRLYEAAGFADIPPYPEAEVPEALHHGWRFMRCRLG
ncbi:GNAT family N-acetyltransferase [Maricaulis maris]|uniref:Acetyltransferase (GNAT) family protein n=1 Tax=Maricaulis maris TaxID=74318 RepID=A0A495DDG4_9PROT|nr:GNAT family N-acetyltransferase [Maricaulis maris]RKR00303.1 acetyltransferase (GNAT) family protein [Maricaulis maris]